MTKKSSVRLVVVLLAGIVLAGGARESRADSPTTACNPVAGICEIVHFPDFICVEVTGLPPECDDYDLVIPGERSAT